jgi:hypothetical protein
MKIVIEVKDTSAPKHAKMSEKSAFLTREPASATIFRTPGGVAERRNAPVLKTGGSERAP